MSLKPKLAGMGLEKLQALLQAFDARQTQDWQKGRITFFTKERDEILKFIAKHSARTEAQNGFRSTIHVIGFENLKHRWRWEGLGQRWMKMYPYLFDVDPELDRALFTNQGVVYGRHFNEWLALIVLSHVTGFHALNQKYQFKRHKNKRKTLESLEMPNSLRKLIDRRDNRAQCPDLLMYDPNDPSKWFFCEVKGPGDRLQPNQLDLFRRLRITGGKSVFVLSIAKSESLVHPTSKIAPELVISDGELRTLTNKLPAVL